MRSTCLLTFCLAAVSAWGVDFAERIPAHCEQAALVVSHDWSSTSGTLQRFTRTGAHARWLAVGKPVPVLLGKRGLAWGLGLHAPPQDNGPRKREGDLCSPAGIFALGPAFGRTPQAQLAWMRMPYHPLSPATEAIDDPTSRFYNRVVERTQIAAPDWHSSEHMWQVPDYELGVVVGHNPEHRPGFGSCIFLHLWQENRIGTVGCTALYRADLIEFLRWLDSAKHPVLVQLPETWAHNYLTGF